MELKRTLQEYKSIEDFIDDAPFIGVPLIVLLLTAASIIIDGFDIQSIAIIAPSIIEEWQIDRAAISKVLAAGLIGMLVGSLLFGRVGDRYGRRTALLTCMVLVSVASFGCAYVNNTEELTFWRAIGGLGMGGALPNAAALVAEYSPRRLRNIAIAITIVGVPIGGMLGAAVSAELIPIFGWRSILTIGGVLPVIIVVLMWIWLPESPAFLASHSKRSSELPALLKRIRADRSVSLSIEVSSGVSQKDRSGLISLLSLKHRRDTILLWLIFGSSFVVAYSFLSWTPTILSQGGFQLTTALQSLLVFNLGGVAGSLVGPWIVGRVGSRRTLLGSSMLGVGLIIMLSQIFAYGSEQAQSILVLFAIIGFCLSVIQVQIYTLAAASYPTPIRSTGVGWAAGMGRFGGIWSSFIGSFLLTSGGVVLFFLGVAALLCVTFVGIWLFRGHASSE